MSRILGACCRRLAPAAWPRPCPSHTSRNGSRVVPSLSAHRSCACAWPEHGERAAPGSVQHPCISGAAHRRGAPTSPAMPCPTARLPLDYPSIPRAAALLLPVSVTTARPMDGYILLVGLSLRADHAAPRPPVADGQPHACPKPLPQPLPGALSSSSTRPSGPAYKEHAGPAYKLQAPRLVHHSPSPSSPTQLASWVPRYPPA
jgi:hypothetical protein